MGAPSSASPPNPSLVTFWATTVDGNMLVENADEKAILLFHFAVIALDLHR